MERKLPACIMERGLLGRVMMSALNAKENALLKWPIFLVASLAGETPALQLVQDRCSSMAYSFGRDESRPYQIETM